VRELAAATGLGGRGRLLGDQSERARKAVTARIRDAIARIERLHPALGAHLRASVTTGTFCAYPRPGPRPGSCSPRAPIWRDLAALWRLQVNHRSARKERPMYDVIVVGARVAGSSTAMLLARKGYKVLVVDRASFPSDTLSTHQVHLPAVARLRRWGLLERVVASGAPATRTVRFDTGQIVLEGRFPAFQGVDALYSPRRTVLDRLLVEAAGEAGAEVREGFTVEELLLDGGRVAGIRGRPRAAPP
jgi:hypothetical protein